MYNKIKNIFLKIISGLLCFIILLSNCFCYAEDDDEKSNKLTVDEVMRTIYKFALHFEESYGGGAIKNKKENMTIYDQTDAKIKEAYRGKKTSNPDGAIPTDCVYNDKYAMDCLGWVSFVIHYSTGLELPKASEGIGDDILNTTRALEYFNNCFENVSGELKPGDIVVFATDEGSHTGIWAGNNKFIDCNYGNASDAVGEDGGVELRSYSGPENPYAYRVSEEGLKYIGRGNLSELFTEPSQPEFEYKGLQQGKFGMKRITKTWILNSLKEFLDWYVGMTTYLIRAIFVGIIEIVEDLIDNTMEAVAGEETDGESEETSLTIEKLLFNKVPILDVNFFNFDEAGGKHIKGPDEVDSEEDVSVLYVIRENIASWYYSIRNLAIILLLVTLIYLGIRAALSTVAEEKARYKDMLKGWLLSFVIVFFSHYIMLIILTLNEEFLSLIGSVKGEESLYDSIRNGAYAIQASVGWRSLVFYLILIYMLIKFLFVYIKRYVVVAILTLMAPFIGVLYSLDKIKDNKSQSFDNWLREYTFNVIIQSIHALLYSMYVGLAFNMAGESAEGAFIAVILMMFLLKAESIFKKIFGIKSGNMTDVLKKAAGFMIGTKAIKTVAGANTKMLSKIASPVTKPIGEIHRNANEIRRDNKIAKLKNKIDVAKAAGQTSVSVGRTSSWTDIGGIIEGKRNMDFDQIQYMDSQKIAKSLFERKEEIDKGDRKELSKRLSQIKNTAKGSAMAVAAIPMTAVGGAEGIAPILNARKSFKKGINSTVKQNGLDRPDNISRAGDKRTIKGYGKIASNKFETIAADLVTGGLYSRARGVNLLNKDYLKNRENAFHNAQYEVKKKELDKKASDEFRRLLNNAAIDEKELKRVYNQAKTKISETIIEEAVFTIELNIRSKLPSSVHKVVSSNTDYEKLGNSMRKEIAKQSSNIKFDRFDEKEFQDRLEISIRERISSNTGIRSANITKKEIQDEYRRMSIADKEKIINDSLYKSIQRTEKRKENDKWIRKDKVEQTQMNLTNVNSIIDNIAKDTGRINTERFKDNFKELMTSQIALTSGIHPTMVTDNQINTYISTMTHDQLITNLKTVSTLNSSVVDNNLHRKAEYQTLLDIVQQSKDAENKMKGKK